MNICFFGSKWRLWIQISEFCLQPLHILSLCKWLYNLNFTIITAWIFVDDLVSQYNLYYYEKRIKCYVIVSVFYMISMFSSCQNTQTWSVQHLNCLQWSWCYTSVWLKLAFATVCIYVETDALNVIYSQFYAAIQWFFFIDKSFNKASEKLRHSFYNTI